MAALAPLTAALGEGDRGIELADAAVTACRDTGFPHIMSMGLAGATETAVLADRPTRTEATLREWLSALQGQSGVRWVADALEVAALVLERRRDLDGAVEALGTAEVLRDAAGTNTGGIRVIAADVRRARRRLEERLDAERFGVHLARGGRRSPQAAISDVLARLDEGQRATVG